LFFITTVSGQAGNIQQYVHEYYSVARFKATYAHALPALEGKQQWDIVDPGFKLSALVLKRAVGRPRKSRIRPRNKGAGLGARKCKYTRCDGSSHFANYCDNAVDPAFKECFDDEMKMGSRLIKMRLQMMILAMVKMRLQMMILAMIKMGLQNSDNDQNEAPFVCEKNEDPFEALDVYEQNDAPIDGEQNDVEQNDAPNFVVVSSTWYVILANTILGYFTFIT
jgi:hypothetical protein